MHVTELSAMAKQCNNKQRSKLQKVKLVDLLSKKNDP